MSHALGRASSSKAPPHLDFRQFVDELRKDGDLADINQEVDPHLEVAAITRRVYERRAKAPLFNNVKGAHDGLFRIIGASGGLRRDPKQTYGRLARHLGLAPDASVRDIIDLMLSAKGAKPLPPVHVESGPCKEVKIFGDDIDLTKLPVPLLNKADGGDYIQTMGINIVQHPTEQWTNWSIARAMIHDKDRLAGLIMKPQHIARIFEQWENKKEDMPFAIALGAPPIAVMAASMPLPAGVTEAEYVGSLCGSPLELVKCETNDMYVPANTEIVLEGTVSVTEKGHEGPFGEMHGYSFLDEGARLQPLYKVTAITHRRDAILPICVPGRATGPDETHTMIGTLASAEIRQLLQDNDLPVTDVFTLYESQVIWAAVQVDRAKLRALGTNAKDFCNTIGNLVFRNKCGMQIHRLLVVGDDIDPFSFEDVMWAYATRCRPGMDEFLFEDVQAYPLVPYMSHGPGTKLTGGKAVANCLLPLEYSEEQNWVTCDFENGYPEEVKEKVLRDWDEYKLED
ncbi:UbiD-domain-containing protein [Aaosphaeria arxii CBS 175.79]|uniref:Ferulic acid decarboxylase 1 n=1 Tax=Aaosphaeria arxii CBS 175.79 TaxID=1450172 RepID=A0A6A5X6Q6_9PLEO|nr:UbiD-domain-containing protein [Aaosphaeria arxii CBS 175.79]KAF2008648.1 UbiD-domain-containing protein [Aaosphaeria arxii CBS 175.79]